MEAMEYEPFQEEPISRELSVQSPTTYDNVSKEILNVSDMLQIIKHDMKGEFYNEDMQKWERVGTKLMEEEAIQELISTISTVLNKVVFMSNFQGERIPELCHYVADDFDIWLAENWERLGIRPEYVFTNLISDKVQTYIEAGLNIAKDGGLQKFFTHTVKEHYTTPQAPQKKSFWSKMNPFG